MDYYKKFQRTKAVPAYFEEHLSDVIRRCREAKKHLTEGGFFLFITDIHIYENSMSGIPLMREIGKHTSVKKVFCGGDFPWAFGTKEECLTDGYVSLELMSKVKEFMDLYIVRGNHEFTIRTSRQEETGYTAPYDTVCEMIMPYQSERRCGPEGAMYYYVDDEAEKIRYIVVDTCTRHQKPEEAYWGTEYGFDEEQRRWLTDEALRIETEGWSVVVLGHVPCVSSLPSYSEKLDTLAEILKDFRNKRKGKYADFTDAKAEFVAYICGHNHHDSHSVEDHTLFLSTGSSARLYDDCWERAEGTVAEELFDIFIVDKRKKKLTVLRVGAGESREFIYGEG